jgi:hypothetical protein
MKVEPIQQPKDGDTGEPCGCGFTVQCCKRYCTTRAKRIGVCVCHR